MKPTRKTTKPAKPAPVASAPEVHNPSIVGGLASDVAAIEELLQRVQIAPGPITPDDQDALDRAQVLVEAAKAKLAQLTASTPV